MSPCSLIMAFYFWLIIDDNFHVGSEAEKGNVANIFETKEGNGTIR